MVVPISGLGVGLKVLSVLLHKMVLKFDIFHGEMKVEMRLALIVMCSDGLGKLHHWQPSMKFL